MIATEIYEEQKLKQMFLLINIIVRYHEAERNIKAGLRKTFTHEALQPASGPNKNIQC